MPARVRAKTDVETAVLTNSRRRYCLCVYLNGDTEEKSGQIAHINRDRADSRHENLAWLCLEHHNEYDSRQSQSKGFTPNELIHYRDLLHGDLKAKTLPMVKAATRLELRALKGILRVIDEGPACVGEHAGYPCFLCWLDLDVFATKQGTGAAVIPYDRCIVEVFVQSSDTPLMRMRCRDGDMVEQNGDSATVTASRSEFVMTGSGGLALRCEGLCLRNPVLPHWHLKVRVTLTLEDLPHSTMLEVPLVPIPAKDYVDGLFPKWLAVPQCGSSTSNGPAAGTLS